MKLGIFGGTFNPIHYGHLRAAQEAGEILSLDRVLLIPSGNPPLKDQDLADSVQRYKMCRMAVLGNRFFEVLDIECSGPGKSYTVNTLEKLRGMYQGAELYFMLGIDAFLDIPNWWQPETLLAMTNFVVLSRPGSRFADLMSSPYLSVKENLLSELDRRETAVRAVPMKSARQTVLVRVTGMDISSTDIRRRMRADQSIKYLLPEEVESFILSNRLYANQA